MCLTSQKKQYFIFEPCLRKRSGLQINTSLTDHSLEITVSQLFQISKPVFQISKPEVASCEYSVVQNVKKEDIHGKAFICAERKASLLDSFIKPAALDYHNPRAHHDGHIQLCLSLEHELQYKSAAWAFRVLILQLAPQRVNFALAEIRLGSTAQSLHFIYSTFVRLFYFERQ